MQAALPAPQFSGTTSRPSRGLLAGSQTNLNSATRNNVNATNYGLHDGEIPTNSSPGGASSGDPNSAPASTDAERAETNPFIQMLRSILPTKKRDRLEDSFISGIPGPSAIKRPGAPRSSIQKPRFAPGTREPTPGTLRPVREKEPKVVASERDDRFSFPARWTRKRAKKNRANTQIAQNDANDLEDEIWHLWIQWEAEPDNGSESSASNGHADGAAARRSSGQGNARTGDDPLRLGSMKFIVDTGCGMNLMALKYLENAGATSRVNPLKVPITLNTAGGPSRAVGTVSVACEKLHEGKFDSVVMPETPNVLSVGERCMDHGYSFHWPAGKNPYLVLPNGMRLNLIVEGKIP